MANPSRRAPKFPTRPTAPLPYASARKRQWHRAKLQSDPDYRVNQRTAQQAWSDRNPDYWRNYRAGRPASEQSTLEQQRSCDPARHGGPVKMDVCDLPTGLYRITRLPAFPSEDGVSWVVEIVPVCVTCPCKMDASREDVIDTPAANP